MNLSAGTKLWPYESVARLGAGGIGEVYRALAHHRLKTVKSCLLLPLVYFII
jgi:hypothetical protein